MNPKTSGSRHILCCAIGLVLLLSTTFAAHASDRIVLQLAWRHQFQFAGYYAALHKGFYRDAGLDVIVREGGHGRFAREEVLSGRAQYGVAGSESILHRMDGDPFVVLAPIFQHSPSILLVRKDSGISHPQDLILFTTEDEISTRPRRVEKFLKASLQGWEYAMAHPEEIIDLLLSHYGLQKDRGHLRHEAGARSGRQ